MSVLTSFSNGGSLKDFRDTFNAMLADIAALKAGTVKPTPTPAPVFTVQPSIVGTPQVGQTLTGMDGTITGGDGGDPGAGARHGAAGEGDPSDDQGRCLDFGASNDVDVSNEEGASLEASGFLSP